MNWEAIKVQDPKDFDKLSRTQQIQKFREFREIIKKTKFVNVTDDEFHDIARKTRLMYKWTIGQLLSWLEDLSNEKGE